jgi:hypothetical protein
VLIAFSFSKGEFLQGTIGERTQGVNGSMVEHLADEYDVVAGLVPSDDAAIETHIDLIDYGRRQAGCCGLKPCELVYTALSKALH